MFTPHSSRQSCSFPNLICRSLLLLLLAFTLPAGTLAAQTDYEARKFAGQELLREGTKLGDKGTRQALEAAIDKFREAISVFDSIKYVPGKVAALNNMGVAYRHLGEKRKALDCYMQALPLARAVKDLEGESMTLYNLGGYYSREPEGQQSALAYAKQALPLFIADRKGEDVYQTLNIIGVYYKFLREDQNALDYFAGILPQLRAARLVQGEAAAHFYLGSTYRSTLEYEKALEHSLQSRSLFRAAGDLHGECASLSLIGLLYDTLGESERALDYFNQGLSLSREHNFRTEEAVAHNNLGTMSYAAGNFQEAIDHYLKSLSLDPPSETRANQITPLRNLGDAYARLGNQEKALDYFKQAIEIARAVKDAESEANCLLGIGVVYSRTADKKKLALDHFNQALTLSSSIGDQRNKFYAQMSIAELESDDGNLTNALKMVEASLGMVEEVRGRFVSQDLRAQYFSNLQTPYELYIDLLMRLHKQRPAEGYDRRALEANEQRRARALAELLAEAKVDIRQGVDPALVESERSLQRQLSVKAQQLQLLGGQATGGRAKELSGEIEELRAELQRLDILIRRTSPRYAALTRPRPSTLREIQKLLDPDTLLLEYALGDERSYLWAVTPSDIKSYKLQPRKEIEEAARAFYGKLSAPYRSKVGETAGTGGIGYLFRRQDIALAASRLSRMLIAPVAPLLGKKRLLIVGDGALLYVPFAAVPADAVSNRPLITEHEVVNLPSATALAVLRNETIGRPPAPKTLAVLADPVFERDDGRLGAPLNRTREGHPETNTCSDEKRGLGLVVATAAKQTGVADTKRCIPRLPGTRREADAILNIVPPDQSQGWFDFAANRAAATSAELRQYRYVHFATHGFLSERHPAELSGIVLSLFDKGGAPQDGFLRVRDIYNLKLNADVVVLSACQTGLGKALEGEGLVGLTRGFMYAGTPRVVASLWNVDDKETVELMTRFYRGMLVDKLPPAKALQNAQVSMLNDKRFSGSYNWAAFTVQGEWR